MRPLIGVAFAVALLASACAFVPREHPRLDEARETYGRAAADPDVALHASAELLAAGKVLGQAIAARETLMDPAVVDHLAYLARQRAVLSIEMAKGKALAGAARSTGRGAAK
jgi:hypothetical protein